MRWSIASCRVRKLGDRTNERRRRNPSTRNVRQSLGHGRRFLLPYAYGHSSGTGKCADWCCHDAWNPTPQIRPSSTASPPASLLVGRYDGRLVRSATSGPGKSPSSSIPALVGAGLAQWRWLSAQGIGNKPVNSSPHECRKIGDYSIGTFGRTRGKRASCAQAP
jgi:hypothetical protein